MSCRIEHGLSPLPIAWFGKVSRLYGITGKDLIACRKVDESLSKIRKAMASIDFRDRDFVVAVSDGLRVGGVSYRMNNLIGALDEELYQGRESIK